MKQPKTARCPYCGAPCRGKTCGSHADLAKLEAQDKRSPRGPFEMVEAE